MKPWLALELANPRPPDQPITKTKMDTKQKQARLKEQGLDPNLANTHRGISAAKNEKELQGAISQLTPKRQSLPGQPESSPVVSAKGFDLVEAAAEATRNANRQALQAQEAEERAIALEGEERGAYLAALQAYSQSVAYSDVHTQLLDSRLSHTIESIKALRGKSGELMATHPGDDRDFQAELDRALGE